MNDILINYFKSNISNNGYVELTTPQFEHVLNNFNINDIINSFIEVFASNRNKHSVFKNILISETERKFKKLLEKHVEFIEVENNNVLMKHNYNFDIGKSIGITQLGHYYNDISNYFHIENRMNCSGYNRISPYQIWNGTDLDDDQWKKLLKGFISPLFRSVNDKRRITKQEYRFCFRLSSTVYLAPQFKPEVAKLIIENFSKNGKVLDFSSGWGDRLAGFHTSKNGTFYLGTDPNQEIQNNYAKQMEYYKLFGSEKKSIILNLPAEDVNWEVYKDFDLVFTSPPYFSTELYAKGSQFEYLQSWKRYSNYKNWRDNFLFKTINNIKPSLAKNAIFAINIFDINIKGYEYNVCEDLYEFMKSIDFQYKGYVGMRMRQRPKNIKNDANKEYMASYYVEPIWIYSKK